MNLQNLMKQAQTMQKKMAEAQENLASQEVVGKAANGMIEVTLDGKYETKKININKTLVDADEVDMLEDLILTAFNDAKSKVDAVNKDSMSGVAGGLDLGGMKLPF